MPIKEKGSRIHKGWWLSGFCFFISIGLLCGVKEHDLRTEKGVEAAKAFKIVIDPGHGGKDPGKIAVNEVPEKEINLKISLLLRKELEKKGFQVLMTREEDTTAVGDPAADKGVDMAKRVELMSVFDADICISIHCNSFESGKIYGPQLFFYEHSEKSAVLAGELQEMLRKRLCPDCAREKKPNTSYYILKKSPCPAVIVECGFLSNTEEAEKLCNREYQKKVAKAIADGVWKYGILCGIL